MALEIPESVLNHIRYYGQTRWSDGYRTALEDSLARDGYGFAQLRDDVLHLFTEAHVPCLECVSDSKSGMHDRCARAFKMMEKLDAPQYKFYKKMQEPVK